MTVDAFRPKLTLYAFENVTALRLFDVVPAEMLMPVRLDATLAVMTDPFSPKLTLLPFEKVTAERLFDVVPAETLTFTSSVPLVFGNQSVSLPVGAAASTRLPAVFTKAFEIVDPATELPATKSAPR